MTVRLNDRPRIGIDVSCISLPVTGIGKYLIEILKLLDSKQYDVFLYAHKPLNLNQYGFDKFTINYSNSMFYRIKGGRLLWNIARLPFLIRRDRISLFWAPAHKIPLGLGSSVKKIVTIHDLVWKHAAQTMRWSNYILDKVCMNLSVKVCDAIIVVSETTKLDLLNEFKIDSNIVHVTELGVNVNVNKLNNKILPEIGYMLFVGTLEPRKNLFNLLSAYATLSKKEKELAKLKIVGTRGWGNENYNELILSLGLIEYVEFLGYVSEVELDTLYKNALCLVMPSLYEGFGLPILEAMIRGTPVLTSNVSSMPEVCGGNAVLVDPKSITSIRNGLESIIQDKTLRRDLSARGFEWASKFDWKTTTMKTHHLFEKLMNINT